MAKYEKNLAAKLDEDRIVVINGYIDSEKASNIIFKILTYSALDENEEIRLFIGSEGGGYLNMLAIFDTIRYVPNPISATCVGMAHGYAALLLAGCDKGKRFALKHADIAFEQPYCALHAGANQQTEIAISAKEVKRERDTFEELMVSATGNSAEKVHADCETGISLNAEEALSYGIIDKIL